MSALGVLETTRSLDEARGVLNSLLGWLTDPADEPLAAFILRMVEMGTIGRPGVNFYGDAGNPEERNMLFDNVWAQATQEGREAGIQEGREAGREAGIQEGIALGDRRMRDLVVDQVRRKFGSPTADLLSPWLEGSSDVKRISEVGNWLVDCQSGEELLRRTSGKEE